MKVSDVPEDVKFFTDSGRVIPLLPPRSEVRRKAERMLKYRDAWGWTYSEIAQHEGVAISTAYRLVRAARTTKEVESGDRDAEILRLVRRARKRAATRRQQAQRAGRRAATA